LDDAVTLSRFQETLVRSAFQGAVEVVGATWLQELRPCPILVEVVADGLKSVVVLRIARNKGGVEREAAIYPALRQMGLPVPRILAGPDADPDAPELFSMVIQERLMGQPLSRWAESSEDGLGLAAERLAEAYSWFQKVTRRAKDAPEFAALPRQSLRDDMEDVVRRGGNWFDVAEVRDAVDLLTNRIERDNMPLMFSNGDFAPANLLSDGRSLTGMLDFEKAAFVDPLAVLTRFPVYDLRPLSRTDFIASILQSHGYSEGDFALRVAVFCLRTLQTKCPVEGGAPNRQELRRHVLGVLKDAIAQVTN